MDKRPGAINYSTPAAGLGESIPEACRESHAAQIARGMNSLMHQIQCLEGTLAEMHGELMRDDQVPEGHIGQDVPIAQLIAQLPARMERMSEELGNLNARIRDVVL